MRYVERLPDPPGEAALANHHSMGHAQQFQVSKHHARSIMAVINKHFVTGIQLRRVVFVSAFAHTF